MLQISLLPELYYKPKLAYYLFWQTDKYVKNDDSIFEKCGDFCSHFCSENVSKHETTRLKISSVITRVHKSISIRTQGSKSQCL
jgi:hypothetical protein